MDRMDGKTVGDLMVPVWEHGTVSEKASLYTAIEAFEKASKGAGPSAETPRSVLVLDHAGHPVGELTELDVLRCLEPGYKNIGDLRSVSLSGLSSDFVKSMLQNYDLWQDPLGAICEKAADIHVEDIDCRPVSDRYVEDGESLSTAIHLMVVGQHDSLLVMGTGGEGLVGVLHLKDVFRAVRERIKACKR